jgi:hypothetical protein
MDMYNFFISLAYGNISEGNVLALEKTWTLV